MEDEKQVNKFSPILFRGMIRNSFRLIKIIWPDKRKEIIILGILFVLMSASPFIYSGTNGFLINELVSISRNHNLNYYTFILIGIFILASLIISFLFAIQNYIINTLWLFLEEKFEFLLIKKKSELDISIHEDPKHNNLFNRVNEGGIWKLQNFINRQFYILQNIIEVVIASLILIYFRWWLFLIILVSTLPELISEIKYGYSVWTIHESRSEIKRKYWNLKGYFSSVYAIKELKIFQNIPYFLSKIKELFSKFQKEEKNNEKERLVYRLFAISISQSALAFVIIYFTLQVIKGNLLIGTFTFFLASVNNLRQALTGLFSNIGIQYQYSFFVTDIFKLLNLKPTLTKPIKGIILDKKKIPEIIFDNVTFKYPNTNNNVLTNFSLHIKPGDRIAIVGLNGAGKTSFVKLLCRFYDPNEGKITINGHLLKNIDLESWYSQLGVIFQDYSNYYFTVKEAIAIGNTNINLSLNKVIGSAKLSESDTFIEKWGNKYEQVLGKTFTGGIEPSIGQWQKLALARTFYRNPNVMILDEPTSSIDAEAESKIFDRLNNLSSDKTIILISHRFSTVRQAKKIVVIEKGRLIEEGSHKDLLNMEGTYARLFKLQAKGYT